MCIIYIYIYIYIYNLLRRAMHCPMPCHALARSKIRPRTLSSRTYAHPSLHLKEAMFVESKHEMHPIGSTKPCRAEINGCLCGLTVLCTRCLARPFDDEHGGMTIYLTVTTTNMLLLCA